MEIEKAFGENVRYFRKLQGLSQEQLAELAELDRTYISSIERGERNVSLKNIEKLANSLTVRPEELLGDKSAFSKLFSGETGIDAAMAFYKQLIVDDDRIKLLQMHDMKVAGSVPSVMWELFGAILTGKRGTGGAAGADLDGWEVKSAKFGGSFEYQYHLNTGLQKLEEDCLVNHLFCSYSEDYSVIEVRVIKGAALAEKYFKAWIPLYLENYNQEVESSARRQRFRKSIAKGTVSDLGLLILEVKDGEVTYSDQAALDNF